MNKANLKGVPLTTWAHLISLLITLINQTAISIFEVQLLPFGDKEIYEAVSTVLTVISAIVSTWKDTPITEAAQKGHKVTKELKGGK